MKLNGSLIDLAVFKAMQTAKFPLDQSIPYTLIEQIVKFRVKEALQKRAERGCR